MFPLLTKLLNSLLGSKGREHSTPLMEKQKSQGNNQSLTTTEERSQRSFHRNRVPLRVHDATLCDSRTAVTH